MSRLARLNQVVNRYDRKLKVFKTPFGMLQVIRQGDRLEASDYGQSEIDPGIANPQLILSLTDDWTDQGNPVDWGIEPLLFKLKSMDSWSDPNWSKDWRDERDRVQRDMQRQKSNNLRAHALDIRKDFARATNHINTSTLEKVDRRRIEKWRS